jgi:hypothetical protein
MVRAGDGYHLWYRGRAAGRPGAIGYAYSEDGRRWRKEGGAPVLEPVGEAERGGLAYPSVVDGGRSGVARFQMWYLAGDGVTYRVRHATSVDGRVWQRQEANTVLEAGPIGAWDWPWLQRPTVLLEPSGYLMAYGALGLPGQRHRIGFASSDDGMIWRREPRVLDGRGLPYGEGDLAHPALLVDGEGRMHLWHNVEEGGEPWIAKLEGVPCTAPRESRIYLPLTVSAAPGLGLDACAAEYRETFDRPDGDWDRYEREGTTVVARGGAYHMIVRDDAYLWQAGAGAVAQDFHLEVEARPLDRGQGVYGLYFGAVGDEREYRLLVYESEFTLLRMTGEKEPAVLYDWTPSAHIKTPPSTNRLEIRRSGERIAFSSNGRLVVEVRDDVLRRPGDIGLLAGAARDERFEVRYDNFVLREPDCRPGR